MDNNEFEKKDLDLTTEGADNDDIENNKNIQESRKEDCEGVEIQEEAADKKEENITEQAEADREEPQKRTLGTAQRSSSSYVPPYYVSGNGYGTTSSFSSMGANSGHGVRQAPPKKKVGAGVVVAICVACTVAAVLFGTVLGAFIGGRDTGIFVFDENEEITVLRGNKDLIVVDIPEGSEYKDLSVAQVAALVGDSIVEITTTHMQTNIFYGQYITSGAGSGVIFSQTDGYGYIVTNYHVIEGANEITVSAKINGTSTEYKAEYVAGDAVEDIAVIKISVKNNEKFVTAVFRDFEESPLQVGEEVVAIGNPLGQLGGTVTNGIISALDREIVVEDNVMTLLQTNAAINPGNSGGGLFDTAGNLIGIVNAKQSDTGIEGLGFAIPADKVLSDIEDILELGYISGRASIGISVKYGTYNRQTGLFVVEVGDTDFVQYDRIIAINDVEISSLSDYNAALKELKIGEKATVTVVRGRSQIDVTVTVTENKSST